MCGITGIVLKSGERNIPGTVAAMTEALAHRGPDGEGYLVSGTRGVIPCYGARQPEFTRKDLPYLPRQTLASSGEGHRLAFGHRRLAIIDVGETGHQPMCDPQGLVWITYNGEIYNYIELREELKRAGHSFQSGSDTEVIIAAYRQWGTACLQRFNGMWSFCIYDAVKRVLFASRDRLGVKPFYYTDNPDCFAFASEQKALIKGLGMKARPRPHALREYLVNARLEREPENFFENVTELWPGHYLVYDLEEQRIFTGSYHHLKENLNLANDHLSDEALIEKVSHALEEAVRLRLRSDVEVGTCLSGGIDSSALAVLIARLNPRPLSCFTAVFPGKPFDEGPFADIVAAQIGGKHYRTHPSLQGLREEIDALVYSQDVPIWDSSTYAQYKVMELARAHGVKVVLDGQGADELFGGYHHHFIAKWNQLYSAGRYGELLGDITASGKTFKRPLLFYAKQKLKERFHFSGTNSQFFVKEFLAGSDPSPEKYLSDVNDQLIDDIYRTRLKSFLKCEDRCGMWHSVESRTPFSDDTGLFNLMFSIDGSRKIRNGVSKYLLREAVKPHLPREIYMRYDKKGFETPMQEWMRELRPVLLDEIASARFGFLKKDSLRRSDPSNAGHNKLLFRLFILSRWLKVFGGSV
jgi:asparagine synthase (glutamine-hydrolysing)